MSVSPVSSEVTRFGLVCLAAHLFTPHQLTTL